MQGFSFEDGLFSGIKIVHPFCVEDKRGNFIKDYSEAIFRVNGLDHAVKEIFYAKSQKNVIRGMHFIAPELQTKLIRVLSGKIFDVVVDLRRGSKTFGQWKSIELSEEGLTALLLPGGFAHGYLTLTDAMVSYQCNTNYQPSYDHGILWNDSALGIEWPVARENLIISEKDMKNMSFEQFQREFGGL